MDNRPRWVFPATPEMAARLARRLRLEHVREIADTSGLPPRDAVHFSLASSVTAYALVHPVHDILFMMGVEPAGKLTGAAMIWMVGTQRMDRCPSAVLRTAAWGLRQAFALTGAERLEQYIPAWYATGIRFAARLGFFLLDNDARCKSGSRLLHAVLPRERERIERSIHGSIDIQ